MSDYLFDLPSRPNFCEYVYFEQMMLPHEMDRIESWWDDQHAERALVSGEGAYVESLRRSAVIPIEPDRESLWLFDRLKGAALLCNQQRYDFDLTGILEPLQLARYSQSEFFDWHLDFGVGEIAHRKLSISVQLSDGDEYEGGDLQFRINQREENAPRSRGTVVVFPSFIMHRVTPVTRGVRKSLVAWVSGPPYR